MDCSLLEPVYELICNLNNSLTAPEETFNGWTTIILPFFISVLLPFLFHFLSKKDLNQRFKDEKKFQTESFESEQERIGERFDKYQSNIDERMEKQLERLRKKEQLIEFKEIYSKFLRITLRIQDFRLPKNEEEEVKYHEDISQLLTDMQLEREQLLFHEDFLKDRTLHYIISSYSSMLYEYTNDALKNSQDKSLLIHFYDMRSELVGYMRYTLKRVEGIESLVETEEVMSHTEFENKTMEKVEKIKFDFQLAKAGVAEEEFYSNLPITYIK